MSEDDLKAILAKYQQKSFDLYNQNIVLETQVEQLNKIVNSLSIEVEKLSSKSKRNLKQDNEFQ